MSQWRAYGREGYCIVFDTHELAKLLGGEFTQAVWTHLNLDTVVYHDDDFAPEKYFSTLIDALIQSNAAALREVSDFSWPVIAPSIESATLRIIAPFIESATLLKHRGFKEEREFRIVVAPCTAAFLEKTRKRHPGYDPGIPLKPVYERTDAAIPYVKLFETMKEKLPIKRVIVGPSKRQDENYDRASAILGGQVELVRSETPYIG